MTDLQKVIDTAFRLISSIPVSGDNVEIMASAKQNLRSAYAMAAEKEEPDGGQIDQ